jgi:hypothetical protein
VKASSRRLASARSRWFCHGMGAWGEKAFQNDAALDWLAELEAVGIARLRETLSRVVDTDPGEFIDADDGAAVIAAAEIVAAARGHGRERVTRKVCAWLDANQGDVSADDEVSANRAVRRILVPSSELCALWAEGGQDTWRADVQELLRRLGGDTVGASTTLEAENVRRLPSRVGEREKQAIFAFLQARGFTFDSEQRARIERSADLEEIRRWLARATRVSSVGELFAD